MPVTDGDAEMVLHPSALDDSVFVIVTIAEKRLRIGTVISNWLKASERGIGHGTLPHYA
jgi:hypothetical protein